MTRTPTARRRIPAPALPAVVATVLAALALGTGPLASPAVAAWTLGPEIRDHQEHPGWQGTCTFPDGTGLELEVVRQQTLDWLLANGGPRSAGRAAAGGSEGGPRGTGWAATGGSDGGPSSPRQAAAGDDGRSAPRKTVFSLTTTTTTTTATYTSTTWTTSTSLDRDPPGIVIAWRTAADGDWHGLPIVVSESDAQGENWDAMTITCTDAGAFLVTWADHNERCRRMRAFDADGNPATPERELSCACERAPLLSSAAGGGDVWLLERCRYQQPSHLFRVGIEDAAIEDTTELGGELAEAISGGGAFAIDELGNLVHTDDDTATVLSSPFDGGATALGDLATFPYGRTVSGLVRALGPGRFLVSWARTEQGGRVGRVLAWSDSATTTSTTTTTTLGDGGDSLFPELQILDAPEDNRAIYDQDGAPRATLAADADGVWMATWSAYARDPDTRRTSPEHVLARSRDNARSWAHLTPLRYSDEDKLAPPGDTRAAGNGTWLRVFAGPIAQYGDYLPWDTRSTDAGDTWREPAHHFLTERSEPIENKAGNGSAFGGDAEGGFVIGTAILHGPYAERSNRILLARSEDVGVTWQTLPQLPNWSSRGYLEFDVASAADGDTLLVRSQDGRMDVVRLDAVTQTWGEPVRIAEGHDAAWWGTRSMTLERIGPERFLVVYEVRGAWGHDQDIAWSLSTDDGRTWSAPAPLADYMRTDADLDEYPSLGVGSDGELMATWTSHWAARPEWGMDSDILVTHSSDGGASWSAPDLLRPEMAGDDEWDAASAVAGSAGVWAVLWNHGKYTPTEDRRVSDFSPEIRLARSDDDCGDGTLDVGEQCDDGNATNGDGCDNNCTPSHCGNHITAADEECDDGNSDETDACHSDCTAARCGDGVVWSGVEACDDGNNNDTDACTSTCQLPYCGDGIRQTDTEACDDGNSAWNDACLPDCTAARCGDGLLNVGTERCDDGNDYEEDFCTAGCEFGPSCFHHHMPKRPRATDALNTLLVAVGRTTVCPMETCDWDDDGDTDTTDALLVLRRAAGLPMSVCPAAAPMISFRLAEPDELGSLQFRVNYPQGFMLREVEPGKRVCEPVVPGTILGVNHQPEERFFRVALISLAAFGDGPLVRCGVGPSSGGKLAGLSVVVEDAADLGAQPVVPLPVVVGVVP